MTDLPSGWALAPIEKLIAHDAVFKDGDWVESKDQDPKGKVRLIQLADIADSYFVNKSSRFLTHDKALELNCTFLQKGDLLIARMPDPLGRCCAFPLVGREQFVTVVDVCIIRLGSAEIDPRYLMRAINAPTVRSKISALQSGSTRKRISRGNLATVSIPIAPLNEQRRIVNKIEAMFERIDKGVENLQAARSALGLYRQSLLKSAFEGRLTADWRAANADKLEDPKTLLARIQTEREARYATALQDWQSAFEAWRDGGEKGKKPAKPKRIANPQEHTAVEREELPEIPKAWMHAKLGDLAEIGTGVTPLKSTKAYYDPPEIPWVTSSVVNAAFVNTPEHFVSSEALEETNLRLYPAGTVLLAMYGEGKTRGRSSELTFAAATNQALAALQISDVSPSLKRYVKLFLLKIYQDIRLLSSGGVQPNLNLGIVSNHYIPICSPAEQTEITRILDARLDAADSMEAEIDTALKRADALRQSILKQAFSGKLVPQDPDDEPAAALLARIKAERGAAPKPKRAKRGTA